MFLLSFFVPSEKYHCTLPACNGTFRMERKSTVSDSACNGTFICKHVTDNLPIKWQGSAWVLYNIHIMNVYECNGANMLMSWKMECSIQRGGTFIMCILFDTRFLYLAIKWHSGRFQEDNKAGKSMWEIFWKLENLWMDRHLSVKGSGHYW